MEEEAPALHAGPGRAHRLDAVLVRQGARELYERYSTFMDRFYVGRWKRWCSSSRCRKAAPSASAADPDAGACGAGVPRNLRRRLAEEIRPRGVVPRPLRQPDRQPRHQAQRLDSAGRFSGQSDQGDAGHRGRRFYDHFGIDFAGTARALVTNAQAGGVRQGGSSITQQLAKNLFLNNERTIERKVKEAFLAVWLETRLSKNEI